MRKIRTGQHGVNNFDPQTVLYLTGDVNYSRVHLASGQLLVSSRTLKWFADQWPHFVRVHKNALVNPAYIHDLKLASTGRQTSYLIMHNEAKLLISRRQLPLLLEQFRP
ncbi:LytTR family transcriptional regulator [Spirosoma sp. HMF3257]|uniref:LytTR family transcriptional regulator n=1 Tax=Spirosoma telluris TaxID=2183553 RepID=A0A327NEQ5_9BACT|nr:LytTR family transcriptional regulator [Spirosoma telluris]RAI73800.1 LytTR family transcriptional regulator [Spirosoma telluris]